MENVCIEYPKGKHGAFEPRIDSYEFLPDWEKLVYKIHKYDVKISVELTHPGYKEKNVDILSKSEIEDGYVIVQNFDTGEEEKYKGKLVIAFGEKPNDSIAETIKKLKIPYEVVGDAKSVRKIVDAVREGYMVAKEI